jgi:hypothetical protein
MGRGMCGRRPSKQGEGKGWVWGGGRGAAQPSAWRMGRGMVAGALGDQVGEVAQPQLNVADCRFFALYVLWIVCGAARSSGMLPCLCLAIG